MGLYPLGLAPGPLQSGALLRQAPAGSGPVAAPAMATEIRSAFCSPQEDPFLLLESCGKAIEFLLRASAGRPLRRTWIEHPYGEEEITLLEEEVLPAIELCLKRVNEIDAALESEQRLEEQRLEAADAVERQALRAAASCAAIGG